MIKDLIKYYWHFWGAGVIAAPFLYGIIAPFIQNMFLTSEQLQTYAAFLHWGTVALCVFCVVFGFAMAIVLQMKHADQNSN